MSNLNSKKPEATVTLFCNSCNVLVEATVLAEHTNREINPDDFFIDDPSDVPDYNFTLYKFSICPKCDRPFLSGQEWYSVCGGEREYPTDEHQKLYPTQADLDTSHLPLEVRQYLVSAFNSFHRGEYKLASLAARAALEAACKP